MEMKHSCYTSSIKLTVSIHTGLANLDHNLQVLLIEAGESNLNNPWVYRPGIYPRNMKLDSKTATFYYSRPSSWLDGRRAVVPCAHVLGGGSSINFMMYGLSTVVSSLTDHALGTPEPQRATTVYPNPNPCHNPNPNPNPWLIT